MTPSIQQEIFRAYDIRGKVNEEFFPPDAYAIGLVIGHKILSAQRKQILLGRDGRLSSPEIKRYLLSGLLDSGCDVIDLGLTPTPTAYFAMSHLKIADAVIVTASHNPGHYNGIKMVINNTPLTKAEIRQLYDSIFQKQYSRSENIGQLSSYDTILEDYTTAVVNDIHLKKPLKIAIDCANGVTSLLAERLFEQIGCEVSPLFCELDGHFPNHSPDPTDPDNLVALQELVVREKLDIGIAFDGDGDRVIAVDGHGKILWPDRIMILLAQQVLKQQPNATVVCDIKCSYLLSQAVQEAGGKVALCPTGHSHLKSKVRELNATLGGEFSGHIILRDRWSDFDDGLYAAARLLEALSKSDHSSAEVFAAFPENHSTPEYRLNFTNAAAAQQLLSTLIQAATFEGATPCFIDGLRVDYCDGWGLMRASNTSADLTFRFEAATSQRLEAIKASFRHLLRQAGIKAELPF
ncbi:MAG: phosphomannomutase/phosphoglucomutase [Proteobacteria bacterium]|nr:MAG: phosphomannomutase/phosphoglucomutase [Pseudomonadota bacterium]